MSTRILVALEALQHVVGLGVPQLAPGEGSMMRAPAASAEKSTGAVLSGTGARQLRAKAEIVRAARPGVPLDEAASGTWPTHSSSARVRMSTSRAGRSAEWHGGSVGDRAPAYGSLSSRARSCALLRGFPARIAFLARVLGNSKLGNGKL